MTDNTRLKKLSVNVSKMLEMLEADRQENKSRFETLEDAMDTLLKSNNAGANLHMNIAGNNSIGGSSSPPPFQVRNVKLDFPRFDGSEVLQWIFNSESSGMDGKKLFLDFSTFFFDYDVIIFCI